MKRQNKFKIFSLVTMLIIVICALATLCMGQFYISPSTMLAELSGRGDITSNTHIVIFNIRIPRILMSLLAGAGLAASGAAFQALFSNPLATPDTLGVANGASFGASLAILLGGGALAVQASALAFGISAVLLVFLISAGNQSTSLLYVILSGMVISSLFSALVSLIKYVADPQDVLPVITFWLMGSFSGITKNSLQMGAPCIMVGTLLIYLLRFRLNALSLSEEESRSLGLNLRLIRTLVIIAASLTTAAVVSVCGVIGWVGLLVPHISRMLFGGDNRYVVPFSILFGGLFMLLADTAARCMTASEIPVSILSAVIGAPVFILLLRKTGGLKV